ncbi:unnamed protein product [Absidia cylindrospora]
MPIFTKLNSFRHSVNNPFASSKRQSTSPPLPPPHQSSISSPYSRSTMSASNLSQYQHQLKQPPLNNEPRQRVASTSTTGFAETLKMISKQVQQDQFEDVFGSFFFTEKRCQHRATFMTARLLQNLGSTDLAHMSTPFWKLLMDRFYTLNYLLFVVPSNNMTRTKYLVALEQRMNGDKVGQHLKGLRGGMETYFALYYTMVMMTTTTTMQQHDLENDIYVMEQARKILEHCLDSESKLGHTERDAMYIFHGLRAGLHGHYDDATVVLDDDDLLLMLIRNAVQNNKNLAKQPYVNPFEDDACIVDDDDDDDHGTNPHSTRQVDSGFYDGVI